MSIRRAMTGVALVLAGLVPQVLRAQAAADSAVFRRAQRLLSEGDTTAGHALLDSLVANTPRGTGAHADALYWRALLSHDAAAAQRDLLTITLDSPLLPRAADALLRLARDAQVAGDRQGAIVLLDRLVLEHATSSAATEGWLLLGRAQMDAGNAAVGCAAFDSALSRLPASDVERRRQAQFSAQPCRALLAARPAATSDAPPAAPETTTSRARYSVQVAAYKLKADADRLAQSLRKRGIDARVDELTLFHVRVGAFRTRADAAAMVTKLRAEKINAIVVEAARREP